MGPRVRTTPTAGTRRSTSALTQVGRSTRHRDRELKAANEADKCLWGDMFSLPLYQKPTLLAYDSNYKGIGDNSTQAGPLWNNDGFSVSG